MNTKENDKNEACSFYANEIHLEIMILPYINKQIEKNAKIYLINETNLNETILEVIKKVNLENNKKEEILKLDWQNTNDAKIKLIKDENEESIVLISGSQKFNESINKELENKENFEIVNCYNIDEIDDISKIKSNYKKILNSTGIKEFV